MSVSNAPSIDQPTATAAARRLFLRKLGVWATRVAPPAGAAVIGAAAFVGDVMTGLGCGFTAAYALGPFACQSTLPRWAYWTSLGCGIALIVAAVPVGHQPLELRAILDRAFAAAALILVYILVDRMERARRELTRLSITDPATGIMNREPFLRGTNREFLRARRYGTPLSIVLFEVDKSDELFLRHGSRGIDEAVGTLATVIKGRLRPSDLVGRYDDLQVIAAMPETPTEGASLVAERQRQAIIDIEMAAAPGQVAFTISGGIATFTETDKTLDHMLDRATRALKIAQRAGGDDIVIDEAL